MHNLRRDDFGCFQLFVLNPSTSNTDGNVGIMHVRIESCLLKPFFKGLFGFFVIDHVKHIPG